MNKIIGKNNTLEIVPNFVQDINIKGNNYKCVLNSISKNLHMNSIYINRIEKFHWFYTFKILDAPIKKIIFEIDYNDKLIKTITNGN
jgi:hypothetical protein